MGLPKVKSLSPSERGYNWAWRKASLGFLRYNPLCVMCDPKPVAAEVVDHIVPHRLGEAMKSGDRDRIAAARSLFWDSKNWQSLCKWHHDSTKKRLEVSGRIIGCDVDGRPLDPNHHWNKRT
jgi:5-methylcytosine-specific restriction protein A